MLTKSPWLIAYGLATLLIVLFFDIRLMPIVAASVSVAVLFKKPIARKIDVAALNFRNISWLSYLSGLSKPAGIIHNATDTIVWLNSRSQLKVGDRTTKIHIDDVKLAKIRDAVFHLDDVDVEDREQSFLELSYLLRLDSPLQVRDRFYRISIGSECYRVFECLEANEV